MERERIEQLLSLTSLGILALALPLAFTKRQRDAIALERDGGHCVAPFEHECNEGNGLEVHHVIPQRYGYRVGLTESELDMPENAVTLCKNGHNVIHPDRVQALHTYHQAKAEGRNTFDELGKAREETLNRREPYWVTVFDRALHVTALKQTAKAKKKGWIFPGKRK